MQQTMEILSSMMTWADSGSGSRQTAGMSRESYGSGFNQVFEQELGKGDSQKFNAGHRPSEKFETIESTKQNMIDDDEDLDGIAQTAGVIPNPQNEVVFILEGNMESAKVYNLNTAEDILPQEQVINTEEIQLQPQAASKMPRDFVQILDEEIAEMAKVQTDIKQVAEPLNAETITAKQAGAVSVDVKDVNNGQKIDINPITANDAEARTPEVMAEGQENTGNMSNFSKNGNLSPLENENGANSAEVQEQSESSYSEAQSEENARSALGEKAGTEAPTVTNETLPPLADGIRPEQFRAVQQMTEATLNQPVKPENLFQELIHRVELMQSATGSTMTIKLNPEHLGNVALEVAIDAAGLHVKMNVEDAGVRGMINSQLAALIESLEEKGIEVAEVEVAYTAMEYNHSMFKGDPRGEQRKSGSQPSRGDADGINSKDGATYYTTLPDIMDYYLDMGVSSVEFSA